MYSWLIILQITDSTLSPLKTRITSRVHKTQYELPTGLEIKRWEDEICESHGVDQVDVIEFKKLAYNP